MRQIGARQEAGKVGGIGSCGRELCCSTWLTDFKSVNTTAARYQNLSINQTKLSGQCGRLKCCLNYELDTYLDALQHFPENADVLHITRCPAYLVKKDIFKNLMWYTLPDSSKHFPLSITRVKEILRLNAEGKKPDELEPVEVVSSKPKEVEPEFVDVVGQISLRSLDKQNRKRSDRDRDRGGDRRGNTQQGSSGNRNERQGQQGNQSRNQRSGNAPGQQNSPNERQDRDRTNQNTQRSANPRTGNQGNRSNQQSEQKKPGENQPSRPPQQRPPQQKRQGQQRPPKNRLPDQPPPENT